MKNEHGNGCGPCKWCTCQRCKWHETQNDTGFYIRLKPLTWHPDTHTHTMQALALSQVEKLEVHNNDSESSKFLVEAEVNCFDQFDSFDWTDAFSWKIWIAEPFFFCEIQLLSCSGISKLIYFFPTLFSYVMLSQIVPNASLHLLWASVAQTRR